MLELKVLPDNLDNGVTPMDKNTKTVMSLISTICSNQHPDELVSKTLIQKTYKLPTHMIEAAISELHRAGYIRESGMSGDDDNFIVTQRGQDAMLNIDQGDKINNVTIHGDVSQSAISVDRSESTVNIQAHQLLQRMIQEIQSNQDYSETEKKSLLEHLNHWSRDVRFLAIAQSVLGRMFL